MEGRAGSGILKNVVNVDENFLNVFLMREQGIYVGTDIFIFR